jgi:hypothetical protein
LIERNSVLIGSGFDCLHQAHSIKKLGLECRRYGANFIGRYACLLGNCRRVRDHILEQIHVYVFPMMQCATQNLLEAIPKLLANHRIQACFERK